MKPVLSAHLWEIVNCCDLLQVARLTQVGQAEEYFKEMEMVKKRNIYSTNWPRRVSTSYCTKNRKITPLNAVRSVYVVLVFCILLKWPFKLAGEDNKT